MSQQANISTLFQTANQEGTLSPASLQTLINIPDMGATIQAALGVSVDDVKASEAILVTLMPDDSGSIRFAGNSQAVRDGHNMVVDALVDSKQGTGMLMHTRYLNGYVLYPYSKLGQVVRMTSKNYDPDKGTPLYDQTVVLLGTVLAKAQEFSDSGVPVRTVTLIISDGADLHSQRSTARDVARIVGDMLRTEQHIVAAMGIDDGGSTDFRKVFQEMGIRDEWILTPKNSPSEIRKAFGTFSKSAVRASQSAGSFSQTVVGGFGTP